MATDEKASPDTESDATENSDIENKKAQDESADETITMEIEALKAELEKARAAAEENWQATLRATAELENTRRRLERDVENAHKFAMERFVQELIPVIDSLEMGLAAANEEGADLNKVREGTELTLKKFMNSASKFGIEAINPVGENFNPEDHQAMSLLESSEYKPNTVVDVMQKGYVLQGRLIRPAMVVVAKAAMSAKSKQDQEEKKGTKIDEKA